MALRVVALAVASVPAYVSSQSTYVPYIHGVTQKVKKTAWKQDVQVVCLSPNKAHSMFRRANQGENQKK